MKRFLMFLCLTLLVFMGVGLAAGATWVTAPDPDHVLYGEDDRVIQWEHSLSEWSDDGCEGCFTLTLDIIADDVDPAGDIGGIPVSREIHDIVIFQGDYWKSMGPLDSYVGAYTHNEGPDLSDASTAKHSETHLSLLSSDLGFDLDFTQPLGVRIDVSKFWDVEIEGSTLGINCEVPIPSAFFLLGSGLVGLVGLKRKFK